MPLREAADGPERERFPQRHERATVAGGPDRRPGRREEFAERTGFGQWLGEFVATPGLALALLGCLRYRPDAAVPWTVGLYIRAAYWFTSSTRSRTRR